MFDWIQSQLTTLQSLAHSNVTEWQVVEMALNEASTADALVWYDNSVPMLQLLALFARVDDQWQRIATYQDDDEFGLSITPIGMIPEELRRWPDENGAPTIYRWRVADELPIGQLSHILVQQNERGNIASVEFLVRDRLIQLWAGEVYESHDNSFHVKFMDESVLVQVDGRSPVAT